LPFLAFSDGSREDLLAATTATTARHTRVTTAIAPDGNSGALRLERVDDVIEEEVEVEEEEGGADEDDVEDEEVSLEVSVIEEEEEEELVDLNADGTITDTELDPRLEV
jgi:hypothetical protein